MADPTALTATPTRLTPPLVEHIAQRWLAWVPDPLTPAERAAGYPYRLSTYQVEFSDNVIFHQIRVLNRVYEELLRDHLHLDRPDMLKIIFDRRIPRRTPGVFKTGRGELPEGVLLAELAQAIQQGRPGLRTEVCINDLPRLY